MFPENLISEIIKDKADVKVSDDKGEVLFIPPLYKQRYQAVLAILTSYSSDPLVRVADLGCAELKFMIALKEMTGVEKVLGLDIDIELLTWKARYLGPIPSDYIHGQRRGWPLDLEVFAGSVADHDSRFKDMDAVTMIELIEHLHSPELEKLPDAVFGHMSPRVVVVTTPNREYNVLFPDYGGGMRHWDHKFEWTRAQFRDWANDVIMKFHNYSVTFSGVGWTGGKEDSHGPCSQIATFVRVGDYDKTYCCDSSEVYHLVESYSFPYTVDNRTLEEKILEESQYYINYCARDQKLYGHQDDDDEEREEERIKLESLLDYSFINKLTEDVEVVTRVLKEAGWRVEDGEVFVKVEMEKWEDSDDEEVEVDDCAICKLETNYEKEVWD